MRYRYGMFSLGRTLQPRRHGGHHGLQRLAQVAGLPAVEQPNVERQGKVGDLDDRDLIPQRACAERGARHEAEAAPRRHHPELHVRSIGIDRDMEGPLSPAHGGLS